MNLLAFAIFSKLRAPSYLSRPKSDGFRKIGIRYPLHHIQLLNDEQYTWQADN